MHKKIGAILFALLVLALVYFSILSSLAALPKFFLVIVELALSGYILNRYFGIEGGYGMLLVKTKYGLKFLDKLAKKYPAFWQVFADVGLAVSFGLLSLLFFRQRKQDRTYTILLLLTGSIILAFSYYYITPAIYPLVIATMPTIDIQGAISQAREIVTSNNASIFDLVSVSLLLLGGLMLTALMSLALSSLSILIVLFRVLTAGFPAADMVPGAAPILPGINLPLFSGLIALIVLLVVHEGAHGVLSQLANVKLKSAGIAFLGVLPAGAFVDPDEKVLGKLHEKKQTSVLVAGSTANIFTSFTAFFFLALFVAATYDCRTEGVRIVEGIGVPHGAYVQTINGMDAGLYMETWNVTNTTNVTKAGKVAEINLTNASSTFPALANASNLTNLSSANFTLVTDEGTYTLNATLAKTVAVVKVTKGAADWQVRFLPQYSWLLFVFETLALVFVLNFLVGVINLLPLPVLDGHRLLTLGVKNKNIVNAVTWLVAIAFLLNLLPWIFR